MGRLRREQAALRRVSGFPPVVVGALGCVVLLVAVWMGWRLAAGGLVSVGDKAVLVACLALAVNLLSLPAAVIAIVMRRRSYA